MGKYALVASRYDANSGKFINEKVIKISGLNLTNLLSIDKFSSEVDYKVLWNKISLENDVEGLTTLSVRYIKNKSSSPIYMKSIISNPVIYSCCCDARVEYLNNRGYSYKIDCNNKYLREAKDRVISLIEKKNEEELENLFYNNKNLLFLIKRYMSNSYDMDEMVEREWDFRNIMDEFSRYKVFRGYVIADYKMKHDYGIKIRRNSTNNKVNVSKMVKRENEVDSYFDAKCECEFGMNYDRWLCYDYNTRFVDEDKEEFIEVDELEQMGIMSDDGLVIKPKRKFRSRKGIGNY